MPITSGVMTSDDSMPASSIYMYLGNDLTEDGHLQITAVLGYEEEQEEHDFAFYSEEINIKGEVTNQSLKVDYKEFKTAASTLFEKHDAELDKVPTEQEEILFKINKYMSKVPELQNYRKSLVDKWAAGTTISIT